jgi:biopolymer transport protein TolR
MSISRVTGGEADGTTLNSAVSISPAAMRLPCMAMSMGSGKRPSAEMNVTPFIDVLLVLIIIFMLLPHHTAGERALIPQPAPHDQNSSTPPETVVLQLRAEISSTDARPTLVLNHEPVAWEQLQSRLRVVYARRSSTVLFIKADNSLDFAPIAEAIDLAHGAVPGLMVALLTSQIEGAS